MKKHIPLCLLACLFAIVTACSAVSAPASVEGDNPLRSIVLQSPADQFLLNFLSVEDGKLATSICYNDAICAGATHNGYNSYAEQIAQINKSGDKALIAHWRQMVAELPTVAEMRLKTKEGYNKYNTPKEDWFLINFMRSRADTIFLDITEEMALRCGATPYAHEDGFEGVSDFNKAIRLGWTTLQLEVEAFDSLRRDLYKRAAENPEIPAFQPPAHILKGNNGGSSTQLSANNDGPPRNFGTFELRSGNMLMTCRVYGSIEVNVATYANYFLAIVSLRNMYTGKESTHRSFSGSTIFKGSLTYPQGTYHEIRISKMSSEYDVTINFMEVKEFIT